MKSLRTFLADRRGFTGAEKAIIMLLALGLLIVVARFVRLWAQTSGPARPSVLQTQRAHQAAGTPGE